MNGEAGVRNKLTSMLGAVARFGLGDEKASALLSVKK
jgi:hypothetical protein